MTYFKMTPDNIQSKRRTHQYLEDRSAMSFADALLTEDLEPLRTRLLRHQLWSGIEDGAVERERLALFALQDWRLVREAYRLDALAIATAPDLEVQELLLQKLLPKFFYWMLAYGSPAEKLAAVSASEDIFIQICVRIAPALMRNYGLTAEQIAFFSVHDTIGQQIAPIDETLLARYNTPTERRLITRAVRLSHEFELMFYDTIMQ